MGLGGSGDHHIMTPEDVKQLAKDGTKHFIFDATFGGDAQIGFKREAIKGARFFDTFGFKDPEG